MIRKIFQQLNRQSPHVGENELREFFEVIETKDKELADKKAKFEEDIKRGSRITKHRFII